MSTKNLVGVMGRQNDKPSGGSDTNHDTLKSLARTANNSTVISPATSTSSSDTSGQPTSPSERSTTSRSSSRRPRLPSLERAEPMQLPTRQASSRGRRMEISMGDDSSVDSRSNRGSRSVRRDPDATSTLDLVLTKRYGPPDGRQKLELDVITGILVDDALSKHVVNSQGEQNPAVEYRQEYCPPIPRTHNSIVSQSTSNNSYSTAPDPPSLRQGSHYVLPGAFRMTSGGFPRVTHDDVESCMTGTTTENQQDPTLVQASLVNEERFQDEEWVPSPPLAYCGVSVGDRTLQTSATLRSVNTTTTESPIVEALPMDGNQTLREFLKTRKAQCCLLHVALVFVVLALGTAYGATGFSKKIKGRDIPVDVTLAGDSPSSAPTTKGDLDLVYFTQVALPSYTRLAIQQEKSPQGKAIKWLKNNTFLESYDLSRRMQRFVLATFFFSTGGDRTWKHDSGWLSDDNECTWFFNSSQFEAGKSGPCQNDTITTISLPENNMRGTFPPEMALLSSLEVLEAPSNRLTGFLPTTFGEMEMLRVIHLFDNFISGSIPSELGDAPRLEYLDLEYNLIAQVLPEALGKLTSLTTLVLDRNVLRGMIPIEFGHLTQLDTLYMSANALSGSIPTELGNLRNLTDMQLDENILSGRIPSEIGLLGNLADLTLGNNTLNGTIPSQIGKLSKLTNLDVFYNYLSGTVPSEIGHLTNAATLYLESNQLEGPLPTQLGNLKLLTQFWVFANYLTGTIPSHLGQLTLIQSLDLSYNQFTGSLPTELGLLTNLETLSLEHNDFSGKVPSELGLLSNLKSLRLHGNSFRGLIPSEICLLVVFGDLKVTVDCTNVVCVCCQCGTD